MTTDIWTYRAAEWLIILTMEVLFIAIKRLDRGRLPQTSLPASYNIGLEGSLDIAQTGPQLLLSTSVDEIALVNAYCQVFSLTDF